jgi:hypothetical protein
MLLEILINRLNIIPIRDGVVTVKKKLSFLSELASLGYNVKESKLYTDSVIDDYDNIIKILKKMKGADVDYVPLFNKFPEDIPDDDEYFTKRVLGYIGNLFGLFKSGTTLDSGIIVPEWLFDIEEFGADPITQFQEEKLFRKGIKKQRIRKNDNEVKWFDLEFVLYDEAIERLVQYLKNNLYSKSSIKEALKPDIEFLLNYFNPDIIDYKKVVFKETRTYLMKFYYTIFDYKILENYIDTPTDLLRLFASLTDSDISLSKKIKFPKFSRTERRFIFKMLEKSSNLAENLNTYKGLWLQLGRYLHPGEYADKYPKTFKAFDTLRNGKVKTFNSIVEKLIKEKNIKELLKLLIKRPGVFARKLHHILEISGEGFQDVLNSFREIADEIELKNLLVMDSYFSTIENSDYKTIINKKGKIKILDNKKNRVREGVIILLLIIIKDSITQKITKEKESWEDKKVWIDEDLINYTIPLQQRKASDGLLTLGRGSKIPVDLTKTIRLFIYWKETSQRTDLDLSLIKYDEKMNYLGHVSYTNLSSGGIKHSGDIQSAPLGAAEFIDVDIPYLKKNMDNVRYLVPQIFRYSGEKFSEMTAYSGWMIRENVDSSYKSFDIKTVENKFNLVGNSSYSIPILVDLLDEKIIFVDIYVKAVKQLNNVEGSYEDISTISREMAKMIESKPNMFDLIKFNAIGRNSEIVEDKEEADISFGIKNCSYNVNNIDKILSELI